MEKSFDRRHAFLGAALGGFVLMNVALFLHPMSPEGFLALAFSDPLSTLLDAQGGAVAAFFWICLLTCLASLVAIVMSSVRRATSVGKSGTHGSLLAH